MTVRTAAAPAAVYAVLADITTYESWLDVVTDVEPASGDDPAWFVTLRAKIGPFARSKRLRVIRTATDGASRVRFERSETDGRDHADWIMEARVQPQAGGEGSDVELDLAYSGGLWSGPLDGVLGNQIDHAIERLPAYVEQQAQPDR